MAQNITLVHNLIMHKMEKGEINIESKEALKSIMQEYKIHTEIIEEQLDICKKDHGELRSEISQLIEENRDLTQRLKKCSESTMHRGEKSRTKNDSDVVENLQQQLVLALEEKETLEELWKSCLEEVDGLQEKLQQYQSGKQLTLAQTRLNNVQQDYTEAIQILESRLTAAKTENDQLVVKLRMMETHLTEVSAQIAQVTEKNITLNSCLNEANNHEQEWKSRYLALEAKYIELDKSYQTDKVKYSQVYEYEKVESHLKERLEGALRERDELQTALERCHEAVAMHQRNAASDRGRVTEAVALVEEAARDRDQALAREATSAEEVSRLKTELDNLVEEAGLRVAQEAAAVKKQLDNQLTALTSQLQVVEQERSRYSVEVEQLKKECERLQGLVKQGQGHRQGVVGSQLSRACHQLDVVKAECQQLRADNEELQHSLDKLQNRCRRISREKIRLKQELDVAEQQKQLCHEELAVIAQRADVLNAQLTQTSLELAQWQSETIIQRENLANCEAKISVGNTIELFKRLDESYGQMNDKWRKEMNTLTERFEAKLKKIKSKSKVKNFDKEEPLPNIADLP